MNVSADRESEGAEGDGQGSMQRRFTRRANKAKVLIAYMNRECDAGGQPG
jgi:hypothetical protein